MIIGICGYKQSGKSVASKYLQEKYGYTPHNFKDALIKEIKENFPDLLGEIYKAEQILKENRCFLCMNTRISGNLLMNKPVCANHSNSHIATLEQMHKAIYDEQLLGKEKTLTDALFNQKPPLIRALMKNYGTEVRRKGDDFYWIRKWVETRPQGKVVVDDVRFLEDANMLWGVGRMLIRIIKTGQVNTDTHQTESEIDLITPDYTIEANEGDHQKIYDELDKIIDKLNLK